MLTKKSWDEICAKAQLIGAEITANAEPPHHSFYTITLGEIHLCLDRTAPVTTFRKALCRLVDERQRGNDLAHLINWISCDDNSRIVDHNAFRGFYPGGFSYPSHDPWVRESALRAERARRRMESKD